MGGIPIFFRLSTFPVVSNIDECSVSILTTLTSPRVEALNSISVGDVLKVTLNSNMRAVDVISETGDLCGNITTAISRIKTCLAKGIEFEAKVMLRNGGECQILIRNKG